VYFCWRSEAKPLKRRMQLWVHHFLHHRLLLHRQPGSWTASCSMLLHSAAPFCMVSCVLSCSPAAGLYSCGVCSVCQSFPAATSCGYRYAAWSLHHHEAVQQLARAGDGCYHSVWLCVSICSCTWTSSAWMESCIYACRRHLVLEEMPPGAGQTRCYDRCPIQHLAMR